VTTAESEYLFTDGLSEDSSEHPHKIIDTITTEHLITVDMITSSVLLLQLLIDSVVYLAVSVIAAPLAVTKGVNIVVAFLLYLYTLN
jgi:hypothetical protein